LPTHNGLLLIGLAMPNPDARAEIGTVLGVSKQEDLAWALGNAARLPEINAKRSAARRRAGATSQNIPKFRRQIGSQQPSHRISKCIDGSNLDDQM
jgi:hypothetical protein